MFQSLTTDVSPKKTTVGQQQVSTTLNYRWVALAVAWMAFGVAYAQRLSLGPLAPFMRDELGLSKVQIGFYASSATLGYGLTLIPAGYLTDKIGARWTMCIGQIIAGSFLMAMIFAQGYYLGLIVMFGAGLGLGFLSPSATKAIVEWFAVKERAMAMGIKQTSVNAGGMLTATTLPLVAIAFGWRWGFFALGVFAICSAIIAAFIYKNPPKLEEEVSAAAAAAPRESWTCLFRERDIWCVGLAGVSLFIAEYGVLTYFVIYLKAHLLVPVVAASFLLGSIDLGGLFGKPIAGIISDRLFKGKRKPAFIILGAISTFFTAVFAAMPMGTPQWLILICCIIFGFAAVGWGGICYTMVAELAGKENAATACGATGTILVMGNVLGVPVFGYLSDLTGSWTWSWIYLVVVGLIGVCALFFVREEKRKLCD